MGRCARRPAGRQAGSAALCFNRCNCSQQPSGREAESRGSLASSHRFAQKRGAPTGVQALHGLPQVGLEGHIREPVHEDTGQAHLRTLPHSGHHISQGVCLWLCGRLAVHARMRRPASAGTLQGLAPCGAGSAPPRTQAQKAQAAGQRCRKRGSDTLGKYQIWLKKASPSPMAAAFRIRLCGRGRRGGSREAQRSEGI